MDKTKTRPGGRAGTGAGAGAGARINRPVSAEPVSGPISMPTTLGEVKTTFGWVRAFTVDDERMLIKLDCSAIFRILVSVAADRPNFRTSVTLAMMAYNNNEQLAVRYMELDRPQLGPPLRHGLELGLGDSAFEIDDWTYTPVV